jgi:hypothetical protein
MLCWSAYYSALSGKLFKCVSWAGWLWANRSLRRVVRCGREPELYSWPFVVRVSCINLPTNGFYYAYSASVFLVLYAQFHNTISSIALIFPFLTEYYKLNNNISLNFLIRYPTRWRFWRPIRVLRLYCYTKFLLILLNVGDPTKQQTQQCNTKPRTPLEIITKA